MTLQEFSERYKVKIKRDECGDEIIPGKLVRGCGPERPSYHHHIYPLANGVFAVYLNFPTKSRFKRAAQLLQSAGAQPVVTAEADGILSFDPANDSLVKRVLKVTRCRLRRQLTEEQRAVMRERFKKK